MALNVAQLQTELEAVKTALSASDWTTARLNVSLAETTLSGMELNAGHAGSFVQQRETLAGLRKSIDELEARTNRKAQTSRFIQMHTSYGRRRA